MLECVSMDFFILKNQKKLSDVDFFYAITPWVCSQIRSDHTPGFGYEVSLKGNEKSLFSSVSVSVNLFNNSIIQPQLKLIGVKCWG